MARKDSSNRWQSIAIQQLGYAVGLILSLATASLAFAVAWVKEPYYGPSCAGKVVMLASVASLSASIGLGLWCVVNRLVDFRITRSIARDREDWEQNHASAEEINKRLRDRRTKADRLGVRTWRLFWWQIGMFALGVSSLVAAFLIGYHSRLF